MVFWYLLILLISLKGIQVCKTGYYQDYIDKEQSDSIKGIFILLVFLGHAIFDIKRCGYVPNLWTDRVAYAFFKEMGQLVVAMFLFYSGYGVMKSLLSKGYSYLETYPKSRILTTLLNFDIAICCFILMNLFLGRKMDLSQIVLSFIGWDSVGNSNWYIFIILWCYLSFYVVFKVAQSHYTAGTVVLCLILVISMLVLHEVKEQFWWNTLLVFPAGILFAIHKDKIEVFIQRHDLLSIILLLIAVISLRYLCYTHPLHGLTHNLKSIVFCLLIVSMTMKFRLGNRWLQWCGISLFPLYIYQRLPMNALKSIAGNAWICDHPHLYIGVSLVVTIGIALLYNTFLRIKLS